MVRLSKRAEYGLIAIRHVASQTNVVTAKEIATLYGIPYELLAKVLQKMTKAGLLVSQQGVHGGYVLGRPATEIPVSAIIRAIEGTTPTIAQCMAEGAGSCMVFTVCTIKSPLGKVQANIERAFSTMRLSEIV
ncbi:MAG: Rrf2 family transcriptional regulator [Bacteroidota bacterium]